MVLGGFKISIKIAWHFLLLDMISIIDRSICIFFFLSIIFLIVCNSGYGTDC